jgi:hypothetical protein
MATDPTPSEQTVVLVHGTFSDSSSDVGHHWWQLGSRTAEELEKRLPGNVKLPAEGHVFHWSGENSERERIKAAGDLLQYLQELEQSGRPYHLIGHSHGGSVIWHTLRMSILRRKPLLAMRSWATIGTPFLHVRTRMGNGLSNALSILLALILIKPVLTTSGKILRIFLAPSSSTWLNGSGAKPVKEITLWDTPVLWMLKQLGEPIQATSNGFQIGRFSTDREITLSEFFSHYEGWLFIIVALLFIYVLLNIVIFLITPVMESFRLKGEHLLEDKTFDLYGKRWLGVWSQDDEAINGLRATLDLTISFVSRLMIREPVLASDYLMLVSRPYYWLITPVYNTGIQPLLDRMVRSIVIKKAQGNNRPAAEVVRVSPSPLHSSGDDLFPAIPQQLNDRLVSYANTHASGAAATFRKLLATPSFAAGLEQLGSQISGKELIHTSYFDHPEILDLLTMHIAWANQETTWSQFRMTDSNDLVHWLVEAKTQIGATITIPSTLQDEQPEPTILAFPRIRPRRRNLKAAA